MSTRRIETRASSLQGGATLSSRAYAFKKWSGRRARLATPAWKAELYNEISRSHMKTDG